MPHTPIPDIPGELLQDEITRGHLNEHVSRLCGLTTARFPGSQPVSFSSASLEMLETLDFWVCEKSDGIRILVFIVMNGMSGNQEVWLVSDFPLFRILDLVLMCFWARSIGSRGTSRLRTCISRIGRNEMTPCRTRFWMGNW